MTKKRKLPETSTGRPRLGGSLEVHDNELDQWLAAEIIAVLDMRAPRGVSYQAVIVSGTHNGEPWSAGPIPWHELTWRYPTKEVSG